MSRPHILIVDDNLTSQKVMAIICNRFGFDTTCVGSGAAVMKLLGAPNNVDLILMDWHLEDTDGLEVTHQIREKEAGTGLHMPIVAVTGSARKEDHDECLAAGMDDYLSKPFEVDALIAVLKKWTNPEGYQKVSFPVSA